ALYLEELVFRVSFVGRCERPFGARLEIAPEVLHVWIWCVIGQQRDVATRVVVDGPQRGVDASNPLENRVALPSQLRLKGSDLADRVLVEQLLEALLEARKVVAYELGPHRTVLIESLDTWSELPRFDRILVAVSLHSTHYPLPQLLPALRFILDFVL